MKINPISFKGVYHYQINSGNSGAFKNFLSSVKALEGEENGKMVIDHQNYFSVAGSLVSYKEKYSDIPSVEWMIHHAQNHGIELPKYFTHCDYDIYLLTDQDKKDFEKNLEKREHPINTRRILNKIYKEARKEEKEDDLIIDMLLKRLSKFAKNEKMEFNKFLKERTVEPMNVHFMEDGSVSVKLD